jgi:ABC-type branched-subunit amino acid transport system substrate-binding protein
MTTARLALLAAVLAVVLTGCGSGHGAHDQPSLTIAVNAPLTGTPYVGEAIARGAELAAGQIDSSGGVSANGHSYQLKVVRMDNRLSPAQAVRNVRRAVADHAVAIVDEGTGLDASWQLAAVDNIPIDIAYQGGSGFVDPVHRRNVFRIFPTDHGIAFRLAEYLVPKGLRIALLHDDGSYGQQGELSLKDAFGHTPKAVAADIEVPADATDVSPQVLRARRAGATALIVWAQAPTIAAVISAARGSGWNVPIYTPTAGEDPLVRQELSDHPDWVNGLTFATGRQTAELGPAPFVDFTQRYEKAFGADDVGVKTPTGQEVVQPPDVAMYSYDFVNLLAAAITHAGGPDPAKVLHALEQVSARGANGDERGFNENNHEGVIDDDIAFFRFEGMTFAPVKDDALSATLPTLQQTR